MVWEIKHVVLPLFFNISLRGSSVDADIPRPAEKFVVVTTQAWFAGAASVEKP
jgi:hypothetical protein